MFEHVWLLTDNEAKKLCKSLHEATLPDTYLAASKLLKDIFEQHDIKNLEDKVTPLLPKVTPAKK